jgi:hypothetical protein
MAELQASWIQASSHPADTDRLVLEGLMGPAGAPVSGAGYGVGPGANELKAQAKATPDMSVDVLSGHAWIDGTESASQGTYHGYNDATRNLAVAASDATNPRKDLVVARVRDAQYSGATNAWALEVVTGTAAPSPTEPAVPANAVVLALVDVAAGASSVTNANITDRRRRASALGGVVVCTSGTRPTTGLYEGLFIYETDTDKVFVYSGSSWVTVASRWTSWTPTLTNLTLGNGTMVAEFTEVGDTVHYHFRCTLGSTSAMGTNPQFSVPVTIGSGYGVVTSIMGVANLDEAGVSGRLAIPLYVSTSAIRISYPDANNVFQSITSSAPFTWGAGDVIDASGFYKAA